MPNSVSTGTGGPGGTRSLTGTISPSFYSARINTIHTSNTFACLEQFISEPDDILDSSGYSDAGHSPVQKQCGVHAPCGVAAPVQFEDPLDWKTNFDGLISEATADFKSTMRGHTLNLSMFQDYLPKAVEAGYISQTDSDFVLDGVSNGFTLDVDHSKLPGKAVFRNYKSAYENKATVTDALRKRVADGKTLKLGRFDGRARDLPGDTGRVVANGAVPKKLEPDKVRPYSDHTKSLFNAACDLSRVQHTLDTYQEISDELKPGYFMRVEDVDGAFPCLPIHPTTWKYMYVWWYDLDRPLEEQSGPNTLYVHVFGDFGTSPMPGIWDVFFRCVKAMARVAGVLTLPMPHFVDDSSLIGPDKSEVDFVAARMSEFMIALGCPFKSLKSREAAANQLVLGFWWDSVARTRALEDSKLTIYLESLRAARGQKSVTLHELQVLAGRMHRASLTLPSKSNVFLYEILRLMHGLKYPWHKRRVTKRLRHDLSTLIYLLEHNHGTGLFDVTHMEYGPAIYTDAATDRHRSGGGYYTSDGYFNSWKYGSSMGKRPIVELEADSVRRAIIELSPLYRGKRMIIFCDNASFYFALRKGRSPVPFVDGVIRDIFAIAIEHDFVVDIQWIPTDLNYCADALSRGKFVEFKDFQDKHSSGSISLYWSSNSRPPGRNSINS